MPESGLLISWAIPATSWPSEASLRLRGSPRAGQPDPANAGAVIELPHLGGGSGFRHTITLDADEYLTGISGRSGRYIDSIRFHTNLRTSDTFGGPFGAADYALHAPEGTQIRAMPLV